MRKIKHELKHVLKYENYKGRSLEIKHIIKIRLEKGYACIFFVFVKLKGW